MNQEQLFIQTVVANFYSKANTDILIGYHFRFIEDFSTHLPRIEAFWRNQILGEAFTEIPPLDLIAAHIPLKIKSGEINRWIFLFEQTLNEVPEKEETKVLKIKWLDKLQHFKKVFLQHPLLRA